jgi:hypothetical protein
MRFSLTLGIACHLNLAVSVVIIPGGQPKPYKGSEALTSADGLLRSSADNEFYNTSAQLLMSTYSVSSAKISAADGLRPSGDSFVRGAIQAWGEHLHLVIRPEEVWFTILVQMNFYMNAHAENIRDLFVSHQGQELIYIEDFTWYDVLRRFKDEIQARVKTPWLLDWIMPNFTTTTENDIMTANVLMMGLTKSYFKFEGGIVCGLPSVTLLGEQKDWEALLTKLDHLPDFGAEPAAYKARLKPILSRFVQSFVTPDSPDTLQFWNSIASARSVTTCGAPPLYISGWITGFYFWTDQGRPYARETNGALELDGVQFPMLDITTLPVGYARAPFIMRDFGGMDKFPAYVAAGTMGKQITAGMPAGYADALRRVGGNVSLLEDMGAHSTLKPLSAWMLYGPVNHNATNNSWRRETELSELASGTKNYMAGSSTCGYFRRD